MRISSPIRKMAGTAIIGGLLVGAANAGNGFFRFWGFKVPGRGLSFIVR